MEIPLPNLKAAAAETGVLDSAISAAKALAEEVGPRFRIKTETNVREWQPGDSGRIQEISDKLGLGKFQEDGRIKVLDADGFGVVGYSQILPPFTTRESRMVRGEVQFIGVLPEFRNKSLLLIESTVKDMSAGKEPWHTNAFDDTAGRLVNYFERQGLLDIETRHHQGYHTRPATHYIFRVNDEAQAALARQNIIAETNVRQATREDATALERMSYKLGLTWRGYLVDQTAVAEAKGHDIVGFAYVDPDRNQIKDLGVLRQFHHSANELIERVGSIMRKPDEPITLNAHHSTTGQVLAHLQRTGTIEMTSKFYGNGPLTQYEFVLPRRAKA